MCLCVLYVVCDCGFYFSSRNFCHFIAKSKSKDHKACIDGRSLSTLFVESANNDEQNRNVFRYVSFLFLFLFHFSFWSFLSSLGVAWFSLRIQPTDFFGGKIESFFHVALDRDRDG